MVAGFVVCGRCWVAAGCVRFWWGGHKASKQPPPTLNKPTNQPTNQLSSQPAGQPTTHPPSQTTSQSTKQTTNPPTKGSPLSMQNRVGWLVVGCWWHVVGGRVAGGCFGVCGWWWVVVGCVLGLGVVVVRGGWQRKASSHQPSHQNHQHPPNRPTKPEHIQQPPTTNHKPQHQQPLTNRATLQPTEQPASQPTSQTTNQTTSQPTSQTTNPPTKGSPLDANRGRLVSGWL